MNKKQQRREKNFPVFLLTAVLLLAGLILSILVAVSIGSVPLSIKQVYGVIGYQLFHIKSLADYGSGSIKNIVWLIRFPRVVLAAAVGIGLSLSGVVMQAIVKNPMAEPYVLGISSGASLGATTALFFGLGAVLGGSAVGICAFIGAFAVSVIVVITANIGGTANSVKLILAGMAIGSLCSAFSNFMIFLTHDANTTQQLTFWLLGSFSGAKWFQTILILVAVLIGFFYFWASSRPLNLMLLGDEVSITLGVNLNRYRYALLLVSSLIVGLCVYASGVISFVGLIIPHFARMFFGTNHERLIPISALMGGIFMIWADVLSRILIPSTEIPIGILVSMVGAPVFIYMMVKKSYGFGAV